MARGDSGRIVIEVEPHLKDELYVELARQKLTLKAWFISVAEQFLADGRQPGLFVAETASSYSNVHKASPPKKDEQ